MAPGDDAVTRELASRLDTIVDASTLGALPELRADEVAHRRAPGRAHPPVQDRRGERRVAPDVSAAPVGGRVVLVVDDDDTVRRVVRDVLEVDDYSVVEASSGDAALAALETARPAVIVLDVVMPGIDGIEVCRRLDHDRVKVLILTARGDDAVVEEASREAGADDFLGKPFSSVELLDHVERLATA
jgi:CheY-like chemotaxis protein